MEALRLGIIGMSKGNGHPYSWSAIFNGYNQAVMDECPFPTIPDYLSKQVFPAAQIKDARVTHIWTQSPAISRHVASACSIPQVVAHPEEMIGVVDAILLARDDAENHLSMSLPFLEAGLPIFIDKPLAFHTDTAKQIWNAQIYPDQVFTCSAFRFAREFAISRGAVESMIGPLQYFETSISKSWEKYAVHCIEPLLQILDFPKLVVKDRLKIGSYTELFVDAPRGVTGRFRTFGDTHVPCQIRLFGAKGILALENVNTFLAFRASLEYFVKLVNGLAPNIPTEDTLKVIELIEEGLGSPASGPTGKR